MAGGTIGIAQVTDVMGTFGVVMLCCTFLAFVLASALIAHNVNRLYLMMAGVFATFQATVAGMIMHLRLFWAELVGPHPEQSLVIPDDLPVNARLREVVLYQKMFPSLEGDSSDSSDNDNQDRFEE